MIWRVLTAATILAVAPSVALAQTEESRPAAWDVARRVLVDPTTYAPAVISYESMLHDWKTSQVLFRHGWLEQNPRFTVSGRRDDVPVAYAEGTGRIRAAALRVLQYSALNNAGVGILERLLVTRHPHRKRLIRTLSWVERISFASLLAYGNSADHLRQASANRRLAREYGYVSR
jgi:hypothetical protein